MKDANPRARLDRLINSRNYLGAQLYLKEVELEKEERNELLGSLATAVVDELSKTRRDDQERIIFLRSILAWILREVPGLGSLYREQLRGATSRGGILPDIGRGFRNFTDVASGRKSVEQGISEAADDARRTFEDAADRMRTEGSGDQVSDFLSSAERGIRDGLDQLGAFFRALNEESGTPGDQGGSSGAGTSASSAAEAAARAAREDDVEDAEYEESQDIRVERAGADDAPDSGSDEADSAETGASGNRTD
jgi:hypothetical protein